MDAPLATLTVGEPEPAIEITIVCSRPAHAHMGLKGEMRIMRLRREERWDGSGGHYWVTATQMSKREQSGWQAKEPGDGSQMPRRYREGQNGFRWLRHGEPVDQGAEGRAISNAMFHNAGPGRAGAPREGVLDGVTRHFELPRCRCGAAGLRKAAAPVELVLDLLTERGRTSVGLDDFRALVRHAERASR